MAFNYSWNNLPSVVIYNVFSYLNKQDLLNSSATCTSWRSCLFHPKIWPIKSLKVNLVDISAYENSFNKVYDYNREKYVKKSHHHFKSNPYYYLPINRMQDYHFKAVYRDIFNKKLYNNNRNVDHHCYYKKVVENTNYNIQPRSMIKTNLGEELNFKADFCLFLEKCSQFLTSVTIRFNLYDYRHLLQLIQIINILTHAKSTSSNNNEDICFNNIESLNLRPIYIKTIDKTSTNLNRFKLLKYKNRLNKKVQNSNNDLLLKVFDAIEKFISTNRSIRHISFGCLEELLNYLPSLLYKLKNNSHVNKLVESLNLSTIKVDPNYYPVHDVNFTWFTSFKNLLKLSIDYDYVSDDFIITLASNCKKLKDFTINIHGLDKEHPIVSSFAWNHFKQNSNSQDETCEVKLTINLLHTNESPLELIEILQNVTIPIVNFRAYFAFSTEINNPLRDIVNIISTQHQYNLKQLTLVDKLEQKNGNVVPNTAFSSMEENTLVMLAWRCRNLEELTVIGFELSELDLLAITRLRGENLKKLLIPECYISLMNSKMLEDEGYCEEDKIYLDMASNTLRTEIINEIAKPLNRTWTPIYLNQLSCVNNASQFYLNAMLS